MNKNETVNPIPKKITTNIYTPQYMTDTNVSIETVHIKDHHDIPINTNSNSNSNNKNKSNEIPFDETMVWKETKTDSNEDNKIRQNFVSIGVNDDDNDDDDYENFESFVPAFSSKSEVNIQSSNIYTTTTNNNNYYYYS